MEPILTQEQIIEEFSLFGQDRESAIFYIMDLAERLEPIDPSYKIDDFAIKGCQSKAWLVPQFDGERLKFLADSNTDIVKGLLYLFTGVYSNLKPREILELNLDFPQKIGLDSLIGTQRSNGVGAVMKLIKIYAQNHL
jgi:cysteine desulfuration protein SufE